MPDMLDRKAFNSMLQSAEPDKTMATLFKQEKKDTTKDLHNTLMLAGFSPAYGNIADAVDALLYATEGEFGEAALSGASAIPIIGQFVAGKRALKSAKEAGEEMVTLYRGVDKWYPGSMVKEGKFIGGRQGDIIHVSPHKKIAETYRSFSPKRFGRIFAGSDFGKIFDEAGNIIPFKFPKKTAKTLEFEVPVSFINKFGDISSTTHAGEDIAGGIIKFSEGIPKEFLKKVHK